MILSKSKNYDTEIYNSSKHNLCIFGFTVWLERIYLAFNKKIITPTYLIVNNYPNKFVLLVLLMFIINIKDITKMTFFNLNFI